MSEDIGKLMGELKSRQEIASHHIRLTLEERDQLVSGIEELLQEIARHHKDFDRWEEMADKATKRARMLEKQLQSSLANNLCPDHRDKQYGKPCLACTIETLERKANVQGR